MGGKKADDDDVPLQLKGVPLQLKGVPLQLNGCTIEAENKGRTGVMSRRVVGGKITRANRARQHAKSFIPCDA